MKLAIMQPYFFPYVGYFNLIGSVDKFVFYTDVNFIKGGWINRNRLFLSGDVKYFTIPLSGSSPNLKIEDICTQPKMLWEKKMLESIKQSYSKAPNFKSTFDLIKDVIDTDSTHVSTFAINSVIKCSDRLGFSTKFVASSSVYNNEHLIGVERVLDICRQEQADEYINLPGGRELYNSDLFVGKGVGLDFISSNFANYSQFDRPFVAGLSIIDMMMFNSFDECRALICQVSDD